VEEDAAGTLSPPQYRCQRIGRGSTSAGCRESSARAGKGRPTSGVSLCFPGTSGTLPRSEGPNRGYVPNAVLKLSPDRVVNTCLASSARWSARSEIRSPEAGAQFRILPGARRRTIDGRSRVLCRGLPNQRVEDQGALRRRWPVLPAHRTTRLLSLVCLVSVRRAVISGFGDRLA